MKTFKSVIKWVIILPLLFATINSCKEEEPIQEPSTFEVIHDDSEVYSYQLCRIYVKGKELTSKVYNGSISNISVEIAKANDTTLLFIMPALTAGQAKLKMKIEDENKELNYTILQHPVIENPKEYALIYVDNFDEIINEIIIQLNSIDPTSNINLAEVGAYYSEKFRQQINSLNEVELKILALLIQSNNLNDFTSPKKNGLKKFDLGQEEKLDKLRDQFIGEKGMLVENSEKIMACLKSNNPIVLTVGSLVHLVQYIWSYGKCWCIKLEMQLLKTIPKGNISEIFLDEKSNSIIEFQNNSPTVLSFGATYRNINKNDVNSTYSSIKSISVCISDFISNVTEANYEFIDGEPLTVPTSLSDVEETVSSDLLSINSRYLSISNISNPNVVPTSITKTDYNITVTFSTSQTTDQNFTFDIIYNNPNVSTSSSNFSAKLIVPSPYSIEINSGDNQFGEFGKALANPIKVIVKNEQGNPFAGVKVNFTPNNGGSVSQSQVTTGADGIASVIWTLGGTDKDQTVSVTAFKTDNTTPLLGSPLTFNAQAIFDLRAFLISKSPWNGFYYNEGNGDLFPSCINTYEGTFVCSNPPNTSFIYSECDQYQQLIMTFNESLSWFYKVREHRFNMTQSCSTGSLVYEDKIHSETLNCSWSVKNDSIVVIIPQEEGLPRTWKSKVNISINNDIELVSSDLIMRLHPSAKEKRTNNFFLP
jgi:hypothetical protein